MIMVTHHLEEIPEGFTHAMLINDGQVFAAGEIHSTLTSEKVSEVFSYNLKVQFEDGRFRVRAHK